MKVKDVLKELEALGDERVFARNKKKGAGDNQFGVKMGDIRKVAKKIKTDHALGKELWETGNLEARLVATLVMKPKELSTTELEHFVSTGSFFQLADWVNSYVVKNHPEKESLREAWMNSDNAWTARAGWNLTASRVQKDAEGLDLKALLDRIESEMGDAPEESQWTMNFTLGYIGIHHPKLRNRAIKIGEKIGAFRDYPTSKGCTSPFAPIWIQTVADQQG